MKVMYIDTKRVVETLTKKINTNNFCCYFRKNNSYYNTPDDFCFTFVISALNRTDYFFFYDFLPNNYLIQSNASIALQLPLDKGEYYIGGTELEDIIAESIFGEFFKKWIAIIMPQ